VRYLYAASFVIGLGLNVKILFLWFIGALIIATMIIPSIRGRISDIVSTKEVIVSCLLVVIGAIPFLLAIQPTVSFLWANSVTTQFGVNNLSVWNNYVTRLYDFSQLLSGRGRYLQLYGGNFGNEAFSLALPLAVLGLVMFMVRSRGKREWAGFRSKVAFWLILTLLIFSFSIFTFSTLNFLHLFILIPFVVVLLGLALDLTRKVEKRGVLTASLTLFLILGNLCIVGYYYGALDRTAGVGHASRAIYDLSEWLVQEEIRSPCAMDWGFRHNIPFITKGKVYPVKLSPAEYHREALNASFQKQKPTYLFWSEKYDVSRSFPFFKSLAEQRGYRVMLLKVFRENDDTPVILVYTVIMTSEHAKSDMVRVSV
jgi:hypothetical protein